MQMQNLNSASFEGSVASASECGLLEDLCVVAVARSMNSAGTDLNSAVEQLQQQKLLAHNVQSLLVSQDT